MVTHHNGAEASHPLGSISLRDDGIERWETRAEAGRCVQDALDILGGDALPGGEGVLMSLVFARYVAESPSSVHAARALHLPGAAEEAALRAPVIGTPLTFTAMPAPVDDYRVLSYLASAAGESSTTGMLVLQNGDAVLLGIETDARFAGLGHARAMTARLLDIALRLGARRALLRCDPLDTGVYRAIGFHTVTG